MPRIAGASAGAWLPRPGSNQKYGIIELNKALRFSSLGGG